MPGALPCARTRPLPTRDGAGTPSRVRVPRCLSRPAQPALRPAGPAGPAGRAACLPSGPLGLVTVARQGPSAVAVWLGPGVASASVEPRDEAARVPCCRWAAMLGEEPYLRPAKPSHRHGKSIRFRWTNPRDKLDGFMTVVIAALPVARLERGAVTCAAAGTLALSEAVSPSPPAARSPRRAVPTLRPLHLPRPRGGCAGCAGPTATPYDPPTRPRGAVPAVPGRGAV